MHCTAYRHKQKMTDEVGMRLGPLLCVLRKPVSGRRHVPVKHRYFFESELFGDD